MLEEVEHPIPTKYPKRYAQNIASDSKPNFWSSLGGTVSNKQQNGKNTRNWCLQTNALGRMSSLVLPAVILVEGKSLILKPGETRLFSHERQPVY